MNFHEYQAKDLFEAYGIPVPKGINASSADEAEAAIGALLSNSAEWRRRSALGVDSVAQHHTYRDRLEQILRLASIDVEGSGAAVSRISRADLADFTSPEGEWIADSDSELSPADLEKLWVGVRLAKAEIVGFAPSWELAHTYGTGLPPGPRLLAADHVRRYGLPEDVAAGTRIYLVPPRDDR